jgi:hypothetical protein
MHHYICSFLRVSNNWQVLKGQRFDMTTYSVIQSHMAFQWEGWYQRAGAIQIESKPHPPY